MPRRRRGYRSLPGDQEVSAGFGSYRLNYGHKLKCLASSASSSSAAAVVGAVTMSSSKTDGQTEASRTTGKPATAAATHAEGASQRSMAQRRPGIPRSPAGRAPYKTRDPTTTTTTTTITSTTTAGFDVTVETIEMSLLHSSSIEHGGDSLIGSVLVIDNNEDCPVERELGDPLVYTYSADSGGGGGTTAAALTMMGTMITNEPPVTARDGGRGGGGRGGPKVEWTAPGAAAAPRRDVAPPPPPPPMLNPRPADLPAPRLTCQGGARSRSLAKQLDVFRKRSPGASRSQQYHDGHSVWSTSGSSARASSPLFDEPERRLITEQHCHEPYPPPRIFELAKDPLPNVPRIQALFHNSDANAGDLSHRAAVERKRHERSDVSTSAATLTTVSNSTTASVMRSSTGGGSTASVATRSLSSLAYGRLISQPQQLQQRQQQQQQHHQYLVDEQSESSSSHYYHYHHYQIPPCNIRRSQVLDGFYVSE